MEQLYLTHESSMYRTAMGILHHAQDAEDTVQTACLALCKKISLLMGMDCCTLRSYVVISVRNTAINLIRSRDRKPELLWGEEDYLDSLLPVQEAEDDRLLAVADQDVLNQAVLHLPQRERSLLEMKYILGHNDSEIANALGVKPNSVRSMLTRARRKLAEILREQNHEAQG